MTAIFAAVQQRHIATLWAGWGSQGVLAVLA